ncbi:unnamed protein product [Adineta steineri]|nr:unnamed protein product [Adineta steineri]
MWDFIVNDCASVIVEGIISIALILRVQWQKRRIHQSPQWRKQRRMIIQLCLVSGFSASVNLPTFIIYISHVFGLPPDYGVQVDLYFYFLTYFVVFLFPFASLSQYPQLRKLIKTKVFCMSPRQLPHVINGVHGTRLIATGVRVQHTTIN